MKKLSKMYLISIMLMCLVTSSLFGVLFKPFKIVGVENISIVKDYIFLEILIFIIVNVFLLLINDNLKSLFIFLTIFIYIDDFKIYMFVMTIIYQYYLRNKDNMKNKLNFILNNTFIVLLIFMYIYLYKYTLYDVVTNLKNIYSIIYILISFIIFYVYRKEILDFEKEINAYNILLIGLVVYVLLYFQFVRLEKIPTFTENGKIVCEKIERYIGLKSSMYLEKNLCYFLITFIIYLVYDFKLLIVDKKVLKYIGLIAIYIIFNNYIFPYFMIEKNIIISKYIYLLIITIIFLFELKENILKLK